jgi:single-stranded DNA-binding protein
LSDNFRAITGAIQFEPKEGEAGGKPVRNIVVRQTGFKDQNIKISATVWPSHAHVELAEGMVVFLEGKFSQNKGQDKDGNPRTYNNLSVTRLAVLGTVDGGKKVETVNTEDDPQADDDDIPF